MLHAGEFRTSSVISGAPSVSPAVSNHPEILHRRRICAVPTHWLPPTAHLSRSVIPINKSASIRCSCLSERAMHGPIIRAERPPCRPHHSSQRCPINISGARRTGLVSSPAISPVSSAMVAMLASLYFCFCAQKFVRLVGESEFGVFEEIRRGVISKRDFFDEKKQNRKQNTHKTDEDHGGPDDSGPLHGHSRRHPLGGGRRGERRR